MGEQWSRFHASCCLPKSRNEKYFLLQYFVVILHFRIAYNWTVQLPGSWGHPPTDVVHSPGGCTRRRLQIEDCSLCRHPLHRGLPQGAGSVEHPGPMQSTQLPHSNMCCMGSLALASPHIQAYGVNSLPSPLQHTHTGSASSTQHPPLLPSQPYIHLQWWQPGHIC